jgi:hypothetical protein
MSFFPEPADAVDEDRQPAWAAAPDDVVPGIVPIDLVLGRSDNAVVVLTEIRAFPAGLEISVAVRVRHADPHRDLAVELLPFRGHPDVTSFSEQLMWGLGFADGRKVTSVDPPPRGHPPGRPGDERDWMPDHPMLNPRGVHITGSRGVDLIYWLWPLPPAGTVQVVCQWVGEGINQTVHDLDSQPILDAATRAHPFWPAS